MKTIGEFKSLFDLLQAFPTEESCIEYLEKKLWKGGIPVSPYDPTSKVYKRGDGMYRCKNTGKNFNIRIGTMFEGSKAPLRKWFIAIYLITTHLARHTFATMMLTLGADLYTVCKLLGHTDVKTTQIYAKIINKKKDDAIGLIDAEFANT